MEGRAPSQLPEAAIAASKKGRGPAGSLKDAVQGAEWLLAVQRGCATWQAYLHEAQQGGAGAPCTFVWTAGTIAYRCRTCGITPSSAVCVNCFKAGNHVGHDYQMYISDAGGCCDCGDLASWREAGCCPTHRPGQHDATDKLAPGERGIAQRVLRWALLRALLAAEDAAATQGWVPPGGTSRQQLQSAARRRAEVHAGGPGWVEGPIVAPLRMLQWLSQVAAVPALRDILCHEILSGCPGTEAPPGARQAAEEHSSHSTPAAAGPAPLQAGSDGAVGAAAAWYEKEALRLWQELGEGDRLNHLEGLPETAKSLLEVWLSSVAQSTVPWDGALIQEAVTFFILLLYNPDFKFSFGAALLPFYASMAAHPKQHPIAKAMDRLTVQIFNSEEATLRLVVESQLLNRLLTDFLRLLSQSVDPATDLVSGESADIRERRYLRMGADIHMLMDHASVALHLLRCARQPQQAQQAGRRGMADALDGILRCFSMVQGACPYRRQLGDHVVYERTAWVYVVQLEVHLAHFLKSGLLHPLLELPATDPRLPEALQGLEAALGRTLGRAAKACAWWEDLTRTSRPMYARPGGGSVDRLLLQLWPELLSGGDRGQVSAHLPLNRLAASFLAAMLYLASLPGLPQSVAERCGTLRGAGALLTEAPGVLTRPGQLDTFEQQQQQQQQQHGPQEQAQGAGSALALMALGPLRVLAWMSQIRHGLWVRNGDEVVRLEFFYNSHYWYEHAADMDLLMLQAWAATAPDPDRVIMAMLSAFGGEAVCTAVVMSAVGGPSALQGALGAAARSLAGDGGRQVQCFTDGLRLLVTLLRERWLWLPPSDTVLLRRTLVHALAQGPRSHSQLVEELSYEMSHHARLDEVLEQVAQYSRPQEQQAGLYRLKEEAWAEFDPFYFHYARRELQAALHEAHQQGYWQPRAQLAPPATPLPFFLSAANRLLEGPFIYRLVWVVLRYCTSHCPDGTADDAALAALSLASLGLHHLRQRGSRGSVGSAAPAGGSIHSVASPTAASATADVASGGAGLPTWLPKLLEGDPETGFAPGMLSMVKDIADGPVHTSGSKATSRREYGWELLDCARYLAPVLESLLQSVKTTAQQQQQQQQGNQAQQGPQGGQQAEHGCGYEVLPGSAGGQQAQQAAEAQRRERARMKKEKMLAKMRAQQAQFALRQSPAEAIPASPAPSELSSEGSLPPPGTAAPATLPAAAHNAAEDGSAQQQGPPPVAPADVLGPEPHGQAAMDVDGHSGAKLAPGVKSTPPGAALSGERQGAQARELPAHHPSRWRAAEGECALCHAGGEAGPLGWLAHVQTSPVPMVAAARSQRGPGVSGNIDGASPLDAFPVLSMLCCGHMLHQECLQRYSASLRRRLVAGQDVDGRLLLDRSGDSEMLCPICRRISNTLLPVTHAAARSSSSSWGSTTVGQAALEPVQAGGRPSQQQQPGQAEQAQQPQQLVEGAAGSSFRGEGVAGWEARLSQLAELVLGPRNWVPVVQPFSTPAAPPAATAPAAAAASSGQSLSLQPLQPMLEGLERVVKRVVVAAEQKQARAAAWLRRRGASVTAAEATASAAGTAAAGSGSRALWGLAAAAREPAQQGQQAQQGVVAEGTAARQAGSAAQGGGGAGEAGGAGQHGMQHAEQTQQQAQWEQAQQGPAPMEAWPGVGDAPGPGDSSDEEMEEEGEREDQGQEGGWQGQGARQLGNFDGMVVSWDGEQFVVEGGGGPPDEELGGERQGLGGEETQPWDGGDEGDGEQRAQQAQQLQQAGVRPALRHPPPAGARTPGEQAQQAVVTIVQGLGEGAGAEGAMGHAVTAELLGTVARNAVDDLLEGGVTQAVAVAVATEAARGAVEGWREAQPPAPLALVSAAMIQAMQTAVARLDEDPHLPGGLLARALARELVRMGLLGRAALDDDGELADGVEGVGGLAADGIGEEGLMAEAQAVGEEAGEEEEEEAGWELEGRDAGGGEAADLVVDMELGGAGWLARAAGMQRGPEAGADAAALRAAARLSGVRLPALLWSLLAQGLAQWEVSHRGQVLAGAAGTTAGVAGLESTAGGAGSATVDTSAELAPSSLGPPALVDQASWRALQSIAHLALACPAGLHAAADAGADEASAASAHEALQALQWLLGGAPLAEEPPTPHLPRCSQLLPRRLEQQRPQQHQRLQDMDPFLLVMDLLAALLAPQQAAAAGGGGGAFSCDSPQLAVHTNPAAVLKALLQLVYPLVVCRAVPPLWEARGAPDAGEMQAVLLRLLPWLSRCRLLLALLECQQPPAASTTSTTTTRVLATPRATTTAAGIAGLAAGPGAGSGEDAAALPGPPAESAPAAMLTAAEAALQALGLPAPLGVLQHPATGTGVPTAATAAVVTKQSKGGAQVRGAGNGGGSGGDSMPPPTPEPPAVLAQGAALLGPPLLLPLPAEYQEWYLSLAQRRCSVCGQAPKEPALCLLCGELVCCASRKCLGPSSWGMCYTHAACCGAGSCVFFLPKNTRLLVVRKGRATFAPSPYLDAHGEEDRYLRRGKPLFLSPARYQQLQQLWLGAGFDFDSSLLHAANRGNGQASVY